MAEIRDAVNGQRLDRNLPEFRQRPGAPPGILNYGDLRAVFLEIGEILRPILLDEFNEFVRFPEEIVLE